MATAKDGDNRSADIIKNWLRNRYTIEFLGTWEVIHNSNFKVVEFDTLKGNIRDYATINELICLSNMENLNAVFIEQGLTQRERLIKLNQIAIHQMSVLENTVSDRKLLK